MIVSLCYTYFIGGQMYTGEPGYPFQETGSDGINDKY